MTVFSPRSAIGIVVAIAVSLVLTSCGVTLQENAHVFDPEVVPYNLLDATTTTLAPAISQGDEATVCLVLDGKLLAVGRAGLDLTSPNLLKELAILGPTEGEASLLIRSVLPDEDMLVSISTEAGHAVVDLSVEFSDLPTDQQLLLVAQITCTLTSQPNVTHVMFTLEGESIAVPSGDGSMVSGSVNRLDYEELIVN